MNKYAVFEIALVVYGKEIEGEQIAKFLNEKYDAGWEFLSFLPAKNGIDKKMLFKRRDYGLG